jgi:hypothetical protein
MWQEAQCSTPNGQDVLEIQTIGEWTYVFTEGQIYTMLCDDAGVRLVPCHAIMQEPRWRQ